MSSHFVAPHLLGIFPVRQSTVSVWNLVRDVRYCVGLPNMSLLLMSFVSYWRKMMCHLKNWRRMTMRYLLMLTSLLQTKQNNWISLMNAERPDYIIFDIVHILFYRFCITWLWRCLDGPMPKWRQVLFREPVNVSLSINLILWCVHITWESETTTDIKKDGRLLSVEVCCPSLTDPNIVESFLTC